MLNFSFALDAMVVAGAGVSSIFFGWRMSRKSKTPGVISGSDDKLILRLQSQFGYNEHSFVSMSVQSEVWIDKINNGAVSYNERGRVWVVAGEPVGRWDRIDAITNEFLRYARSNRKVVAFLPTTEMFARSVTIHGARIVKIGASPYFDLENWNPRGNAAKKLRLGVNHGRRAGISVEEIDCVTDQFREEVDCLSQQWASSRRAGVKFGWLFKVIPFQNSEAKKYFAARNSDGKLVGLLAASPIPARDGWYLEDVLRGAEAPAGTSDLLVFETLTKLAAQGAKLATLGTVPLSEKGNDDLSTQHNFLINHSLRLARKHLGRLYNFAGLGSFKSKFVPTWWESEYAVLSRGHILPPRVAHAVLSLVVPGGFIQILQILFFDQSV